jgi:hypothetical protein
MSMLCARAADINCDCAVNAPKPAFARSAFIKTITVFSKLVLSVAQLDEAVVAVAGAFVALGGTGVRVRVAVGGATVVGVLVEEGGRGVNVRVRVAVGGIGVKVRV